MIIGRQSGLGNGLGALIPPKPNHAVITPPYAPRKMGEDGVFVESVNRGGDSVQGQTAHVSPLYEGGIKGVWRRVFPQCRAI